MVTLCIYCYLNTVNVQYKNHSQSLSGKHPKQQNVKYFMREKAVKGVNTGLLKNDIDVTSYKLRYLLPLCGLNRVVALLILPEILHMGTECHILKMFNNNGLYKHTFGVSCSTSDI